MPSATLPGWSHSGCMLCIHRRCLMRPSQAPRRPTAQRLSSQRRAQTDCAIARPSDYLSCNARASNSGVSYARVRHLRAATAALLIIDRTDDLSTACSFADDAMHVSVYSTLMPVHDCPAAFAQGTARQGTGGLGRGLRWLGRLQATHSVCSFVCLSVFVGLQRLHMLRGVSSALGFRTAAAPQCARRLNFAVRVTDRCATIAALWLSVDPWEPKPSFLSGREWRRGRRRRDVVSVVREASRRSAAAHRRPHRRQLRL